MSTLVSRTYMVLENSQANELAREVDNATKGGWKLQGGVSIAYAGAGHLWYAQAMIFETGVNDGTD